MDKLNRRQQIAVWILLAIAVAMYVFPPSEYWGGGIVYRSLLNIESSQILYTQLAIQYALLIGIGWAVVTSLKQKQ